MNYINPYELLGIEAINLSDIDSKTILKEKRKLLQEIELSDTNSIKHNGVELTKADCLSAIEDLDNKDKREFHFFIFHNKPLNAFLSKGSILFFEQFQVESIYKLPDFLDFISKYFAPQYDKILTNNFKRGNFDYVSKILSVKPITNTLLFESCYKGTYSILKFLEKEVTNLSKEIDDKTSPFIKLNFHGLNSLLKDKINIDLINILPSYFQSLRNQLAQSLGNLARDINNNPYAIYEPAFQLIEIANNLSMDGLVKQTITKWYYTIKGNYESEISKQTQTNKLSTTEPPKIQIEDEEPLLQETAKTTEQSKDNTVSNIFIGFLVATCILFTWSFFNPILQKIILSVASFIYLVWIYNNITKKDTYRKESIVQVLISCISFLICIVGFFYEIFSILFVSYFLVLFLHTLYSGILSKPKKSQNSLTGILYLVFAIGITAIWFYNIPKNNLYSITQPENAEPVSNNYSNSQTEINSKITSPIIDSHEVAFYKNGEYNQESNNYQKPTNNQESTNNQEPIYNKVTVKNGNMSDCLDLRPKYANNISTKLIITTELTDAAVKLYDYETDKCIRYIFVNDGTTFTVTNIPEGRYYLKIAYGNDWTVKEGDPICKGHFTSHVSYKKDADIYDFNKKYYGNGRVSTPYYTLKLYRTFSYDNSESNVTSNSISENEFNNN